MITDLHGTGHGLPQNVLVDVHEQCRPLETEPEGAKLSFDALYREHFDFVWRNLRRLGVGENSLRDAAQDVFLVAYRRLNEFEGRGTERAWLFSILRRVASDHRRLRRRKSLEHHPDVDAVPDSRALGPEQCAAKGESLRLLLGLLEELDDDKREILVLVDLEEMTVPEAATAVGANLNTAYSRLRFARQHMRDALVRLRSSSGGHP